MKYFLDSVKKEDIEKYLTVIDGVTSNPILLKKENMKNKNFLNLMKEYNILRFVQISSLNEAEEIIAEFKNDLDKIIFKITMHPEFYTLMKNLKVKGYQVAATTIYDIIQINQAIEMGLDYTMVYMAKNEYNNLFNDAYKLKQITNSNIKLVGASFRDKHEVKKAILSGMNYSTIPTYVMDTIFKNHQLEKDYIDLYA